MKTITIGKYSYKFYRSETGHPVVHQFISGKDHQVCYPTAEQGNEFFKFARSLTSGFKLYEAEKLIHDAFNDMFEDTI